MVSFTLRGTISSGPDGRADSCHTFAGSWSETSVLPKKGQVFEYREVSSEAFHAVPNPHVPAPHGERTHIPEPLTNSREASTSEAATLETAGVAVHSSYWLGSFSLSANGRPKVFPDRFELRSPSAIFGSRSSSDQFIRVTGRGWNNVGAYNIVDGEVASTGQADGSSIRMLRIMRVYDGRPDAAPQPAAATTESATRAPNQRGRARSSSSSSAGNGQALAAEAGAGADAAQPLIRSSGRQIKKPKSKEAPGADQPGFLGFSKNRERGISASSLGNHSTADSEGSGDADSVSANGYFGDDGQPHGHSRQNQPQNNEDALSVSTATTNTISTAGGGAGGKRKDKQGASVAQASGSHVTGKKGKGSVSQGNGNGPPKVGAIGHVDGGFVHEGGLHGAIAGGEQLSYHGIGTTNRGTIVVYGGKEVPATESAGLAVQLGGIALTHGEAFATGVACAPRDPVVERNSRPFVGPILLDERAGPLRGCLYEGQVVHRRVPLAGAPTTALFTAISTSAVASGPTGAASTPAATSSSTSEAVTPSHVASQESSTTFTVLIPDGYGTVIYPSGLMYEGDFRNGRESGKGLISDGDDVTLYCGDVVNGVIHGHGTFFYGNGDKYTGPWKEGVFHGKGRFDCVPQPPAPSAMRKSGPNPAPLVHQGACYAGDFMDGFRQGLGTMTTADHAVYNGGWQRGKRHGKGDYSTPEGLKVRSMWVEDLPEGKGDISFPDGSHYEGGLKRGRREGKGVYRFPHEQQYTGSFTNDKVEPSGFGSLQMSKPVPIGASEWMLPVSVGGDLSKIHEKAGFDKRGH